MYLYHLYLLRAYSLNPLQIQSAEESEIQNTKFRAVPYYVGLPQHT